MFNPCHFYARFERINNASLKRLIGTQVSLMGASKNTICGTIDSVSLVFELLTLDELMPQTYTVACPAEPTLAVLLYDDLKDIYYDQIIMNIVEVMVFRFIPFPGKYLVKCDTILTVGLTDTILIISLVHNSKSHNPYYSMRKQTNILYSGF